MTGFVLIDVKSGTAWPLAASRRWLIANCWRRTPDRWRCWSTDDQSTVVGSRFGVFHDKMAVLVRPLLCTVVFVSGSPCPLRLVSGICLLGGLRDRGGGGGAGWVGVLEILSGWVSKHPPWGSYNSGSLGESLSCSPCTFFWQVHNTNSGNKQCLTHEKSGAPVAQLYNMRLQPGSS